MKYIGLVLLLSVINISCNTVKGSIDLSRNDKGEIIKVEYAAKNMMDFKVKKDEVDVKTRREPKPTALDKVLDTFALGAANRVMNKEDDD